MGFLCSFLRRHLAGKPVVALPNVSCFLKLDNKSIDNGKLLSIGLVAGTLLGVICACRGGGGSPDFKRWG